MVKDQSSEKYRLLCQLLGRYDKLAVAFSGGVDSTVLLFAAWQTLGPERTMAIRAISTLQSAEALRYGRKIMSLTFPSTLRFIEQMVFPLAWQDFRQNDLKRCYYCKKKTYEQCYRAILAEGFSSLADGTNGDDLLEDRPGLQALAELGVVKPLADVGLQKKEIRRLAGRFGLANADRPSNSCLATRIGRPLPIDEERLRLVEGAEDFLRGIGVLDCRVRIFEKIVVLEVHEKDFAALVTPASRSAIRSYFAAHHLTAIAIDLKER